MRYGKGRRVSYKKKNERRKDRWENNSVKEMWRKGRRECEEEKRKVMKEKGGRHKDIKERE